MKIVINNCYGGFGLSKEARNYMIGKWVDGEDPRCNLELIALIEREGSEAVSDGGSDIRIVEIPDEATDYLINEYDGRESVIYVLDGKICKGEVVNGDD
ncbi:MAG: hypothetical protein J6Y02_02235 [Pseudobutyrivibrio sp.]|nr:hypothetical protein [Pseudobutyrivibrio sp.]